MCAAVITGTDNCHVVLTGVTLYIYCLAATSSCLLGVNGVLAWVLHNSYQAGRGQERQKDQGIRNRT
jgi:hypothetical protein